MRFRIPPPEQLAQQGASHHQPERKKEYVVKIPKNQLFRFQDCAPQRFDKHGKTDAVRGGTSNNSLYVMDGSVKPRFIKETYRGVSKQEEHVYVKNTHSNEWTSSEITAAKLAGLTGIAVPFTVYGVGFERNPELASAFTKRKDSETLADNPNYCVASQRLKGYQDFSSFIDTMQEHQEVFFPDQDKRAIFNKSYEQYKLLSQQEDTNHADIKLAKRDYLMQISKVMPTTLRDMVDETYVASMWLGNWDMFNFDMMNMGFAVITNKDGSKDVQPAMVDFGNCLASGFGGKYKRDCSEAANTPAKLEAKSAHDFDPPIGPEDTILPNAAGFTEYPGMLLGTVPRRLPFKGLFEHNEPAMRHILNDKVYIKKYDQEQKMGAEPVRHELSHGFLRGLQRISQISDQAIETAVNNWYMPDGINHLSSDPAEQYSKPDMIAIMKGRRDNMVEYFREPLRQFRSHNHLETEIVRSEVAMATLDLTGQNPSVVRGFEH